MNLAFALPAISGARASHAGYAAIGQLAVSALHRELRCCPKPGLVSPLDSGSHTDMDVATFVRSINALRDYFPRIAAAGGELASFARLRALGCAAEQRMLRATGGVNTHRGAIFHLGLLAAAAGALRAAGASCQGRGLAETVCARWGAALAEHRSPGSHGQRMAQRHGAGGARHEAMHGFPHVFGLGLPALTDALARGADSRGATLQCFFTLLAALPDTNLLYRGGPAGLAHAQRAAHDFLAAGGVFRAGWQQRALALHRDFVARRLSPGGSADLLAAVLFVHMLQADDGA